MTTTGLVLGIISICVGILGGTLSPVGFICGVVGIVLGAISMKRDYMLTGTAKAGFITSIVGTVLSLAASIIVYAIPAIDLSVIYDFMAGKFLR